MMKLLLLLILSTQTLANFSTKLLNIEKITDNNERNSALEYFYYSELQPFLTKNKARSYSKEQLSDVLKAFSTITFYVQNKEISTDYLSIFEIYSRNKWSEKKDYYKVYGALNGARMFAKAQEFYDKYSQYDLPKPLKLLNNTTKGAINVYSPSNKDEYSLKSEEFNFSKETEIIVISNPICHFSNMAVSSIGQHFGLNDFLQTHSRWLVPPSTRWDFEKINIRNTQHPNFKIKYIDKEKDFLIFDYWGTPTFYFLENGKVLDKLVGWPKEGRIKELKALINKYFHKNI
ncbi:hypothetical protein MNBD_GAMMA01-455 [hydrothermal vent metagenome]|uniref:Thioredoxin domain-containing protein n=1 Tax=hydrothermal vent metagenome TaxID=652676 RepID=A0A3B0VL64_9ZZZZ